MTERAIYLISIVSEMLGVHPQTLRLYEREGFIHPMRTDGGMRLYSENDIERIRMIMRLTRELGVNLAGVDVILQMREKMERLQHEMEEAMEAMRREFMEELARREEMMKHPLVKAGGGPVVRKIEIKRKG